ncbi:MAG TPA: hypothetical protein VFQ92_11490 [Blastocatellia bacterium]|nr:hypothetical protein [Blastocatellia bacterium]
MLDRIYERVGRLVSGRKGVKLSGALQESLKEKIATDPVALAGRRVISVNRADGARFNLEDGTWILMRPSGTEPLVRIYAEASNEQDLEVLLESGRQYILD